MLLQVTRIPVLIADGLVLWLTWAKTYHHVQEAKKAGIHMPIAACLINGGGFSQATRKPHPTDD